MTEDEHTRCFCSMVKMPRKIRNGAHRSFQEERTCSLLTREPTGINKFKYFHVTFLHRLLYPLTCAHIAQLIYTYIYMHTHTHMHAYIQHTNTHKSISKQQHNTAHRILRLVHVAQLTYDIHTHMHVSLSNNTRQLTVSSDLYMSRS